MSTRTWRVVACAVGVVVGVSSVGPALAETPGSPGLDPIPAALDADLTAAEEQTLAATTSGDGVPLAAFVSTPAGPEIVTLDAGSPSDAATAASLLEAQPSVEAANVSTMARPTDSTYADELYGNAMIKSELARAEVDNSFSDVVVAVLDTGVATHPELASALVPGHNFTDSPGGSLDSTDRHGHGTHVAGTIAADAGSDIEGVAHGVRVMPVKVLGDDGPGWDSWIADGIVWAANHDADVINMSLGGPGYSSVEASAIAYARSQGVTVIAAAGNDNSSALYSPAGLPGVISVAAVDDNRARAQFSNHGAAVDVAAPGVDILSAAHDGGFVFMSGTSMAAPHVAGVAALVAAAAPGLTPDQVEQAIVAGAADLGTAGRDNYFGHGLVDAPRAVQAANSLEGTGTITLPPLPVPGAPVMTTPDLGSTTVRVKWTAPASDGGSPVTGYTVRAYRGATLLGTRAVSAATTSYLATGLPNGTAHRFTVVASNVHGAGPAGDITATPRTVPGATRIGAPSPGAGSAVVTWAAPLSNGGSPLTGYSVRVYRGATWVTSVPAAGAATSVAVPGLTDGVAYTFVVYAQNDAGYGPASARSIAVVPGTPVQPRITGVAAARSSATVVWSQAGNGTSAIKAYVVCIYYGSTLGRTVTVAAGSTRHTAVGLRAGVGYAFSVTALNAVGASTPSARSATVVPRP